MSSSSKDLERAITLAKAKQNEYYIEAVKSALQSEQQRKLRLEKVATHVESKRLEKIFAKERRCERERLQQIQEDHALLLQAKIADWKANGVPPQVLNAAAANEPGGDGDGTSSVAALGTGGRGKADTELAQLVASQKKKSSRRMSKEALNRLATPRVTVQKAADAARPSTASAAGAAALRLQGETSQDVQFLTDIYRKQDKARLHRAVSLPALNPENLRTLTETDLLHKKMHLLQQLHGVVSQQERILTQDDQCTVRSSVSSWKSSDFTKSTTAYTY
ncbi:hypothetical protein Gpo141_00004545 [Globisporangium polare]